MRADSNVRKQLETAIFPDLGAMMEGYARAAVEVAKREYKRKLDFTVDSAEPLDEILVMLGETPDYDLIMVYDEVPKTLRDAIRKVQSRYGLEMGAVISVLLIAEPELPQARHEPYVINACREGVTL